MKTLADPSPYTLEHQAVARRWALIRWNHIRRRQPRRQFERENGEFGWLDLGESGG